MMVNWFMEMRKKTQTYLMIRDEGKDTLATTIKLIYFVTATRKLKFIMTSVYNKIKMNRSKDAFLSDI